MKNLLVAICFLFIANASQAQADGKAIGLRLGSSNFGVGTEISYQHGFSSKNRIELDLGWRSNRHYGVLGLSAIYHWAWNIDGGLNWYIGPGGQIGFYSHNASFHHGNGHYHDYDDFRESGAVVNIGGQIGLEYEFNEHGVPLQLSLDARPMWGLFSTYYSGLGYGGALGIRYTF